MNAYTVFVLVLAAVAAAIVVWPSVHLPLTTELGLALLSVAAMAAAARSAEGALPGGHAAVMALLGSAMCACGLALQRRRR